MASNELVSGNDLVDNIKLKVNSLMTLLAKLQEPSYNFKLEPSICKDIYTYIKNVENDCQKVQTNNKYNVFPNQDYQTHNSFDRMKIPKSIQTVKYSDDHYNGQLQKFEDEIDFHVDKVIKSIQQTADILTINHNEISQLDKQTDNIYQKLNSEKDMINNEIDKFNNINNMEKEFCKWKERLKQNNEINISLTKEALKLISKYQQKIQEYLKTLEIKIEVNEKDIMNKRQQIEDENNKIKDLKNNNDIKQKSILDNQHLIEEKQSQLKDIELKYEKESIELEKKKLQWHNNQRKLKLMQSIIKQHDEEIKEKVQFYQSSIIKPLKLKLKKNIELVEYEKKRNNEIEANVIKLTPEFKMEIDNYKLQSIQLEETLSKQQDTMKQFQDNLKKIEINVLHDLDISTTKIYNFMSIFDTMMQYKTIMENNNEIKQKNKSLECELFQKQYELKKKKDELENEENLLTAQLDNLKLSIRQQAAYNKDLSHKFSQLSKYH